MYVLWITGGREKWKRGFVGIQKRPRLETIEIEKLSSELATGFHQLCKFLPTFHPRLQQDSNITHRNLYWKQLDHPLHQLWGLITMRLLVVVVVLELVEVLSNENWAQLYVTIRSTRRTRKVSTHPLNLRKLAWLPKRLLQRSPLSMPTLRTCSLRTWLPDSSSTLESTIMLWN